MNQARFYIPLISLLLASPGVASAESVLIADRVSVECRAQVSNSEKAWIVELDSTVPLAAVNSDDVPAEYSSGHARVRLALEGPALVIGLKTGRLLVTDAKGKGIGYGQCQPPQYVRRTEADAQQQIITNSQPNTVAVLAQRSSPM